MAAAFEAADGRPFSWGSHDCCLWACDCVAAMTGVDPAAWFRGACDPTGSTLGYSSRAGARRALGRFIAAENLEAGRGFAGALEAVAVHLAARHGMTRLAAVALAGRGDLVFVEAIEGEAEPPGPALGIVDLSGTRALFAGEKGLASLPLARAEIAWRV